MTKTRLYNFDQNNTGGSFVVNENISHRVVIEAENVSEATNIAESLGIYFNGCDSGDDCPCCGDRWYGCDDLSETMETYGVDGDKGYPVYIYEHYDNPEKLWQEKYGNYHILEEPKWVKPYSSRQYTGSIQFRSAEDYLQFMADEYGWSDPDIIVHYKDGSKKTFVGQKR